MAEEVTPPTLAGAGVANTQGTPPTSLMSMLSQAPLPADSSLLAAMPRQSPGQAYAQAAAGGVSAMTGAPNPVMQQMEQQRRQSMDYAQLQQRVMEQRMRRDEGVLNLSKDLLKSDSPEARNVGARGVLNYAKQNGMDVGNMEGLVKSMAIKRADLGAVLKDMALGMDDAAIALRHPDLDPQTLQQARASAGKDDVRKLLGLPTSRQEAKEVADLRISEATALDAESGLKGAPPELKLLIDQEHRRLSAGKPYSQGDEETKRQAYDLGYSKFKAESERKQMLAEQTEARRAMEAAQMARNSEMIMQLMLGKGGPGGGQPGAGPLGGGGFDPSFNLTPKGPAVSFSPTKPVSEGTVQQINAVAEMSASLNRIGEVGKSPKAKKQVEKYLGPYAQYRAAAETAVPGGVFQVPPVVSNLKADLANFKNYTLRLMSGAAVTASEEPRLMEEIPHMGLPPDQFWTLYERSRKKQEELKKRTVELALSGSQKSMSIAKELGLIDPSGRPTIDMGRAPDAGATAPPTSGGKPLPPGTRLEGGQLVSEDGKHVWKGGKWTPR